MTEPAGPQRPTPPDGEPPEGAPPGALIVLPSPDGGLVVRAPDASIGVGVVQAPARPGEPTQVIRILQINPLPGLVFEVPLPEADAAAVAGGLTKPVVETARTVPQAPRRRG